MQKSHPVLKFRTSFGWENKSIINALPDVVCNSMPVREWQPGFQWQPTQLVCFWSLSTTICTFDYGNSMASQADQTFYLAHSEHNRIGKTDGLLSPYAVYTMTERVCSVDLRPKSSNSRTQWMLIRCSSHIIIECLGIFPLVLSTFS